MLSGNKTLNGVTRQSDHQSSVIALVVLAVIVLLAVGSPARAAEAGAAVIPPVPTPGLVTMLDLGATQCVPCKMMAPLIEELKAEYQGRASIIFIDVWQHREQARRFGIKGIPTQIFYDREGREVGRHVGFLDKKSIISVFNKLGVPQ